jgi:hypothetical protein
MTLKNNNCFVIYSYLCPAHSESKGYLIRFNQSQPMNIPEYQYIMQIENILGCLGRH